MSELLTGNIASFLDAGNQESYTFAATDLLVGLDIYNDDIQQSRDFTVQNLNITTGTLVYNSDDYTYTFTSNEGYTGAVNISYTVSDQFGSSIEMTNSFTVVDGTDPNRVTVLGQGPIKNSNGAYPGEEGDAAFGLSAQDYAAEFVSQKGFTGAGDNYWTAGTSAWIDPDGGTVTKVEGSLESPNATINDDFPNAWGVTSDDGYTGYDQVLFTLTDNDGNTVRSSQSRLYLDDARGDLPSVPTFDTNPTTEPDPIAPEVPFEGYDPINNWKPQRRLEINPGGPAADPLGDEIVINDARGRLFGINNRATDSTFDELTGVAFVMGADGAFDDGTIAGKEYVGTLEFDLQEGYRTTANFNRAQLSPLADFVTPAGTLDGALVDTETGEVMALFENVNVDSIF